MATPGRAKRFAWSVSTVLVAVGAIAGVFYLTSAGSLEPAVAPAATMHDLSSVYDAIASTTYDSSSITADSNGSAFQIAKCIIAQMTGGSCP